MFPSERLPSALRWTPPALHGRPDRRPEHDFRRHDPRGEAPTPPTLPPTLVIGCPSAPSAHTADPGLTAAVRYAVEALGVEHVVVFGRAGVEARGGARGEAPGPVAVDGGERTGAHTGARIGWRTRLRATARWLIGGPSPAPHHLSALTAQPDVGAHVREHVRQLAHTPAVQRAWGAGHALALHGLVCDVQGSWPVMGALDGPARAHAVQAPASGDRHVRRPASAPSCVAQSVARYGWAM